MSILNPSSPRVRLVVAVATVGALSVGALSAASYFQDFDGVAEGATDLGDGSILASNNSQTRVTGGGLRLIDDAFTSMNAVYKIPALANASLGWTASFTLSLTDATGAPPADGFSFSWGAIPFDGSFSPVAAEEGWGGAVDSLAFQVDTWDLNAPADPPDMTLATFLGGTRSDLAEVEGSILDDDQSLTGTVNLAWDPVNGASFETTGFNTNANFVNVPTPGFVGSDSFVFAFAGRTGGATVSADIDDLRITTIPEPSGAILMGLSGLAFIVMRRRRRM